ncbi:MAG: NAD(P)H-dependent dehydrogenase/reductase [Deltaproteobacteria bacterium]|nr:MAG: NAD(P)H-dependent dehydrogenase/reductase [Deltaproteobacteria bacterium]
MFMSLVRARRSQRTFVPDTPLTTEQKETLLEAALRAPSSRSLNPWEFIAIDDPSLLEKLSYAKPHGASFLKLAPFGIVVIADPDRCDVWVEDCAIAAIFIQMAAEELGLGSCWIQVRKRMHDETITSEAYIRELLKIPENRVVAFMIAVGIPNKKQPPHPNASLLWEKIHYGVYGGRSV